MKTQSAKRQKLQRVLYFVCQLERWQDQPGLVWDGRSRLGGRRTPEPVERDRALLFSTN